MFQGCSPLFFFPGPLLIMKIQAETCIEFTSYRRNFWGTGILGSIMDIRTVPIIKIVHFKTVHDIYEQMMH